MFTTALKGALAHKARLLLKDDVTKLQHRPWIAQVKRWKAVEDNGCI